MTDESSSLIYQNLRRLINAVDELRDVGLQQYINLPRICVVGTQSAGKSSVLEAIVGMDFLPRGDGIVTRRPLELRLVHIPESIASNGDESWAVFDAKKNERYSDFDQVKSIIEQLTEEKAGKNKGIVDDPIVLSVHGVRCPDLTLIDLPGITRVPLKGSDQTDDIERLTRDMATRYAKDPRTIILAVVPANADMSTSDALQLARRVDPKGLRTIGVITKIDLMDRGTDASKMLTGEEVPLRLGYTGIRNRSQAEIKAKLPIVEALKEEKVFFATHPVYRTLPPNILGTQSLIEKLTKVLFRHIKTHLPEIKMEINNRLRAAKLRLDELGLGVPTCESSKVQLMWSMITDYCEMFRNTIRGKFDKKIQLYFENQDITSGSHIRSIFNDLLRDYVDGKITAEMTDYDIDVAIRMHEGDSLPGFPSPDTFEYLILPHLRKIHSPVLDCLDRVTQSLEITSQTIANRVFSRFPHLSEQILEHSSNILSREKENTKKILESVVSAEIGYLFTNDSRYLTDHGSMLPMHDSSQRLSQNTRPDGQNTNTFDGLVPQNSQHNGGNANSSLLQASVIQNVVSSVWSPAGQDKKRTHYSSVFIREIRDRLDAYFSLVLRNVRDIIPKIIGFFLVRQIQEKLQFELYNDLNKSEQLTNLLREPPHILEERTNLLAQISTFKKALLVLQRDPSISASVTPDFDESYDFDLEQQQQQQDPQPRQSKQAMQPAKPGVQAKTAPPSHHLSHQQQQQQQALISSMIGNMHMNPPTELPGQSTSHLFRFRSNKPPASERKQVAGSSLFGDRSMRTNETDAEHLFADAKTANPLY